MTNAMLQADADTETAFQEAYDERLKDRNVREVSVTFVPAGYGAP